MIFDNESKRYTISMYNQMLVYYRMNIGNYSMYGGTKITDRLIKNLEDRRNQLTRNILYNG